MNAKNSRCIICGKFFDSMKDVKEHKDKEHRITNSKIIARLKGSYIMMRRMITSITDWLSLTHLYHH
jgi:hypothetical protein